jgi:hypothetical protein
MPSGLDPKSRGIAPKKRGLGRGLEALLTDVLIKVEAQEDPAEEGDQAEQAMPLREWGHAGPENTALQQAKLALLEEAEALRTLIEDLEKLARAE